MKILVTGASGNVGRYVISGALEQGLSVKAAMRTSNKCPESKDIEVVDLDFTKPETFSSALAGVNAVFLMRPPHLGKAEDLYPFIDATAASDIDCIIFLSLMGIEKNPMPPHYKIEKYIEKSGMPYVHIRPGFFMQNLSGIHAEEIKKRGEIWVPAGYSKTSFIDAKDIGTAIAFILKNLGGHLGRAYTLTGSEALDYDDIAKCLSDVLGIAIAYRRPSLLGYRKRYIKERGLDPNYVNVTVALYIMTRLGTAKHITDDFIKLVGRAPRTFEEFARDSMDAWL